MSLQIASNCKLLPKKIIDRAAKKKQENWYFFMHTITHNKRTHFLSLCLELLLILFIFFLSSSPPTSHLVFCSLSPHTHFYDWDLSWKWKHDAAPEKREEKEERPFFLSMVESSFSIYLLFLLPLLMLLLLLGWYASEFNFDDEKNKKEKVETLTSKTTLMKVQRVTFLSIRGGGGKI